METFFDDMLSAIRSMPQPAVQIIAMTLSAALSFLFLAELIFLTQFRFVFPLLLAAVATPPAWAILFYTFLPSNGAGLTTFAPPRRVNPADVAVPPGYCIQPVVTGLRTDARDLLVTYVLDAEPDHRTVFPEPSIWPLLAALATTGLFIGSIFTPWAVPIGAIPVAITLTGWFWPKKAGETGTQMWPIAHRTLPKPNEAPAGGAA